MISAMQNPSDKPTALIGKKQANLNFDLIQEELNEYWTAVCDTDIVKIADSLGDLLYVVYDAANTHGLDMEPIVTEIHRSNMSKFPPQYRADGKVLKGPYYTPPNLWPIIQAQGALPAQMELSLDK